MAAKFGNSPRSVSAIDAPSKNIGNHLPTTNSSNPPTSPSPEAQERSPVIQHPANSHGHQLLDALWRSRDRIHQLGIMDRFNNKFKNISVDGVADAVAQALKLSTEGKDAFDPAWQRFLKDEYTGIPTTLGTIYYDAMQVGWNPEEQFQIIDVAVEGNA